MGSNSLQNEKPHAVCIPYPAQGHINPMLKLAKILHHKGFHITFVNTEFNHKRLLKSRGSNFLNALPTFRFEAIPDGLPPSDVDATQDIPSLSESISTNCTAPFKELLAKLNRDAAVSSPRINPPVSCIVSDGGMIFTLEAAEEFGIPEVLFWTASACASLGYCQFSKLIDKGIIPFKDAHYLTNGELDQTLDWIPGMKNIRLRDLPTFMRTTDPDDVLVKYILQVTGPPVQKACAIVLNSYDELEQDFLQPLSTIFLPPIYTIGPLNLMEEKVHSDDEKLAALRSNLWKEEPECLEWLDKKDPKSVVYVNFGSITVMTSEQLVEFAWGLANSQTPFLWIIRPDLVSGDSAVLPPEFLEEVKGRGLMASWCPQEQVLKHKSVGGFLTHNGWNSTLESISYGVPMICWPFFADQQTNCWACRTKWGIGMEIDSNVKRDEVENLVRELMAGEKGKIMKEKSLYWKNKGEEAAKSPSGSSCSNLEKIIKLLLQS
ncbi:OLC1v1024568C1 [Oldenlandia corymbosa var. corymbosa]|uniref:7-deoxyloganetin glucosyltransferase n=1 Tax=Oldenlandia corymbosa var. corymbosa TaxID=529605 RepID=A0AAV1C3K1_OLDCO|nr:OLC1v1024568C1 [Oldenlandia corymbosa var. corymbosa]